ncbi:hypothetical protein JT206_03535 [Helicobacter pylori]|nr:hypothetical protein [Helicobacter pylori]
MLFLGLQGAGNNRFYPISPTPMKRFQQKTNFSRLEICFLKPLSKIPVFYGHFKSGFNTS